MLDAAPGQLVGRDPVDPHSRDVPKRLPEADRIGDVARACLELVRRPLVDGPLERDVGDHVAAALPWWHPLEDLRRAVEHADPGRPEDLVAGEDEEVGSELSHVDRDVRHGLRPIDEHPRTGTVGQFDDLLDRSGGGNPWCQVVESRGWSRIGRIGSEGTTCGGGSRRSCCGRRGMGSVAAASTWRDILRPMRGKAEWSAFAVADTGSMPAPMAACSQPFGQPCHRPVRKTADARLP